MRRAVPMPWWFWAAGAAILLGGSAALVVRAGDKNAYRLLLRERARARGVDEEVVDAISKIESGWDMTALNCSGADGARGCAIGGTQITWKTAQEHGYTGSYEQLRASAWDQADLTARILAAGNVGSSTSKAAAYWNAGRTSLASAPAKTQTEYYPRLLAAHTYVRYNPPGIA